ncbi:MAG: bifunctional riboflavin biosynthesis protein RibAB [Candidatus Parcubacteria bacterium]|jgi:3,4-dihydroxy 2-butanone 4-phosphate synthase/GTP cyclohydrolase II
MSLQHHDAKTKRPKRIPGTKRIVCTEPALLPTAHGTWTALAFHGAGAAAPGETHVALVMGDVAGARALPVRVQSECLTSEVFGSRRCDCALQLRKSMAAIRRAGRGMIIYLRQEGRGIGIFQKLRAYHLQDHGFDTVEANTQLGLPPDAREYSAAAAILKKLGVASVRLMTNNPAKLSGLRACGVTVSGRIPVVTKPTKQDRAYLRTKKEKMGHLL